MRGLTRRRALVTGFAVLALATVGVWNQRRSIAQGLLTNEFARRGVQASYRVANIGFRWERLEHIVIGDPKRPDLTADWAEVRLSPTIGGVRATAIRTGGVRLRGLLANGKISWGAIDKLLPVSSGGPFTLPDLDVDVSDARIALATTYGLVGARIDGKGNLTDGFRGKLGAIASALTVGSCTAERGTAYVDFVITKRSPALAGPLRAAALRCNAVLLANPALRLNVALSEAFDRWQGNSTLAIPAVAAGANQLSQLGGAITFTGNPARSSGTVKLTAAGAATPVAHLADLTLDGRFLLRGAIADAAGTLDAARLTADASYRRSVQRAARASVGLPVGPLLARLASATGAASTMRANAIFAAQSRPAGESAIVRQFSATSTSGAKLTIGGGDGIRFGAAGLLADTRLALSGGGFPDLTATLRRTADGQTRGVARIAPFAAPGARLVSGPIRFTAAPSGASHVSVVLRVDGPLGSGRITGLTAPVAVARAANGNLAVNAACTPLSFETLAIAGLRLAPTRLRLCPTGFALYASSRAGTGGGAIVSAPRLTGFLGSSPIKFGATDARFVLADNRFAVRNLAARIGNATRISQLAIGQIDGRVAGGVVSGRFAALGGHIGNLPLLIADGAGAWALNNGILTLGGAANVADEARPVRFNILRGENVQLRLANSQIAATGTLFEPQSHAEVARVTITHDLGSGRGHAALDVADLRFGKRLQPEALTPLTLGVIANLDGALSGRGDIGWAPAGVTSTGHFATKGFDLAAAFGPVQGLRGDIVFTDLLGLVTAPGQLAQIDSVNPGIAVLGGQVRYHLAAGQRIVVEGGRWPFAGGALVLDPATLDMGQSRERRLTFRIEGLDAAKFIEQLQFENLAATGVFDGSIPMIFDADGGRIAGGRIAARPGGGTLAYVGEVSNAQMNVFAKLAFDALKSMRYNNLVIGLDGPLDGEMVSRVDFAGVNQGPAVAKKSFLARQFSNLPFKFNITIRAPFRSLLNTARTFQDPGLLLRQLPPLPPPIQPGESERRP